MLKKSIKTVKKARKYVVPGYEAASEEKRLNGMKNKKKYAKHDIGECTYGNPEILCWGGKLKIGRFCSIGPKVCLLLGGNHFTDKISTYPFSHYFKKYTNNFATNTAKSDIEIGSDVWLGYGATILGGVKIGHGAIVGARSVVTKDIPPYAIVAGNPAKIIKMRLKESDIAKLLKTEWWSKNLEEIRKHVELLQGDDVDAFVKAIS